MAERRVCFVNRFYWPDESATAQILSDVAQDLAAQGFTVEVFCSRLLYTDAKAQLPREERHSGVRICRLWSTRFGRDNLAGRFIDYLTFYLSVFVATLTRLRRGDVLVMKTDPPLLSVPGALVARLRGVQLVAWCQDLFPEVVWARTPPEAWPVYGKLLKALRNASLRRAAAVVTLGEDMERYLKDAQGIDSRVVILPNFSDDAAILPLPVEQNPLRKDWGLEGAEVIGYSGNLGRVHEYATFLQAAALLIEERPNLRLLFIGSGALRTRLQAELPEPLRARCVFKGYQPRERLRESLGVPDVHWLSLDPAFRALVFPSKLYGILAAGRPAVFVGDARSELAQALEAAGAGRAADVGDAEGLAQCFRELLDHAETRAAMGSAARSWLEGTYTRNRITQRWGALLEELGLARSAPATTHAPAQQEDKP